MRGTLGYTAIEGWPIADSLYTTIITITTVGRLPDAGSHQSSCGPV